MKKVFATLAVAILAGCGGGSDSQDPYWTPIWVYSNCVGVTSCAFKEFDTEYPTKEACMASPEVKNTLGMPINVRATCYYSE